MNTAFSNLYAALLLATFPATIAQGSEPIQLVPGHPVQVEIQRAELRSFELEIAASGIWRIAVQQKGIDIVLVVRDPAGTEIGRTASPLYRKGTVRWTAPLDLPGTYRIKLETPNSAAPTVEIRLQADDLTLAPAQLIAAEQAMTRADTLQLAATNGARRSALEGYRSALLLWRQTVDRQRELETLYAMARMCQLVDDESQQAITLLTETVALAGELDHRLFEASALADLGLVHRNAGDLVKAEAALTRSMELHQSLSEPLGAGAALNTRCMITHARGDLQAAMDCYREALVMIRRAQAASHEASILNNIGYAYDSLGEPNEALDHYHQALEIHRFLGDRLGEAQLLNNIAATTFRSDGDGEGALAHYDAARKIFVELEDRRQIAAVIHNQGETYRRLGNHPRAVVFFQKALEMRRQLGDTRRLAVTLNGLGQTYRQNGELELARDAYREALLLARKAERQRNVGLFLANLGRADLEAGDVAAGLRHLDEAAEVSSQTQDPFHSGLAWHLHAAGLLELGDTRGAEESLAKALALRRSIGDRLGETDSLRLLAQTRRRSGDIEGALTQAQAALTVVETLQKRIVSPEVRMTFRATRATTYELVIDLLMEKHLRQPDKGFAEEALAISERARARTLFELLRTPGADQLPGVDASLAQRRLDLRQRLSAKASRLHRFRERGQAQTAAAKSLQVELESLLTELDITEAAIHRDSPIAVGVTKPLRAAAMRSVLGTETVLLQYSLGRERSFLWLVTADRVESHVLPPRAEIAQMARELHHEWSVLDPRSADRDHALAMAVSRHLLGPIWHTLGHRRIAVVADGALNHLPFAALPVPDEQDGWSPLVRNHEVVHLPSLSVLVEQRQRGATRASATHALAVLADPVFAASDSRLQQTAAETPTDPMDVSTAATLRSAWNLGDEPLPRLPYSRREAKHIARLIPDRDVWLALDFQANREVVMGDRLSHYRTLHFATHGVVSEEQPELSGLALSMVDEDGNPLEGYLRLRDIYDLELSAELVVLSGCRTALGKSIRGEGLIGLSRAFLSAGAERVVASLWWVQDQTTPELMNRFYSAMLNDNLSPAAALRQAQLQLLKDRRLRDPFYWAPFVHQGDWE